MILCKDDEKHCLRLIFKENIEKYIALFIMMFITLTSCVWKEKITFNKRDKMNLQMINRIVE